jgi:hypothetical protein
MPELQAILVGPRRGRFSPWHKPLLEDICAFVPNHRSTRCDCIRLAQVFGTSISRNVTAEIHRVPHLVFRLLFWYPAILLTETWPNS